MNKIVIIGYSDTNKNYAYSLINKNINIDEIVFIAKKQEDMTDMNTTASFFKSNTKIKYGTYKSCKDANILVITGNKSIDELSEIVNGAKENGFSGIYLLATSNINVDCYNILKLSHEPTNKAIGIGSLAETAYLNHIISDRLEISVSNVNSYVLGNDKEYIIPFDVCNIGVLKLSDCFNDDTLESIKKEFLENFARNAYTDASSLSYITDVLLNNRKEILTASSYDTETGIYINLPSIIDRNGVKEVINIDLNELDQNNLYSCISSLKKQIEKQNL